MIELGEHVGKNAVTTKPNPFKKEYFVVPDS